MRTEYLRPKKAKTMQQVFDLLHCRHDLSVDTYTHARLRKLGQISPPKQGAVAVDDNDFCALIEKASATVNADVIKGTSLYGGYLRKIWGHFVMGATARLWPLLDEWKREEIDHVLFFVNDENFDFMRGNYLELFRLLGIEDKIILIDDGVIAERLLVPEISYEHDRHYSPQCKATFDLIITNALAGYEASRSDRRVFLTRSRLKDADINEINIDALDAFFRSNGFEELAPESLSLIQMIRIFNECEWIASISGSTAHNFVFAPDTRKKRFTVMERIGFSVRFQVSIDKMTGADTVHVDGFLQPKLESSQDRIFLYYMTEEMKRFCTDYALDPSAFDRTITYGAKRSALQRYLRRYRRYYGHSDGVQPWETEDGPGILEAIVDTREYMSPWLKDFLPLFPSDYLSPRYLARWLRHRLHRPS